VSTRINHAVKDDPERQNALALWNSPTTRIGYSHDTMTNEERMQRESSLIATIRRMLPEFAKMCRG
jgi:hypothetical protein